MHRKAFRTNLHVVPIVERLAKLIDVVLIEERDRCMMQFVRLVANLQRFPSSQAATSRFTAGTVTVLKNKPVHYFLLKT